MRKPLLALLLILLFARPLFGQTTDNSATPLGDVAKKNDVAKKDKDASAKAKHVFTDDDMSLRKSPIPSITLQGVENTEEILNAIHDFRASHDLA